MTDRAARPPRDIHARERLRDAQVAEARAVSAVCTAQTAVDRAHAKREQAIAAAARAVARAERALAVAHTALVEVSGLERAAVVLGLPAKRLRQAVAAVRADGQPQ